MLTRTTLIAAVAALAMTGPVMADGMSGPRILTDDALDGVVAGAIETSASYAQTPPQAGDPAVVPLIETGQFTTFLFDGTVSLASAMLDHNNIFGTGCVHLTDCLGSGSIPRFSLSD